MTDFQEGNQATIQQSGDGKPPWSTDPTERFAFDPNFNEFGDYSHRAIQTLNILDDSSQQVTSTNIFQQRYP